jgi:hypothetical protein
VNAWKQFLETQGPEENNFSTAVLNMIRSVNSLFVCQQMNMRTCEEDSVVKYVFG